MSIALIDASSDSLTVSWPASSAASPSLQYVLQYRKATDESQFETLSDKLSSTQARKRNLSDSDGVGFFFRVSEKQENGDGSWITHSEPFFLLSQDKEKIRMAAPSVMHAGANLAARVTWKAATNASGYELQMRENEGGAAWETIAPNLSGTEVKKKNLKSKNGYQFRVRYNDDERKPPFSPPSEAYVALGLSDGMKQLFGYLEDGVLLKTSNQPPVSLEEVLGGKEFVLLYVSCLLRDIFFSTFLLLSH